MFRALPAVRRHVRPHVQCHTVAASVPGLPPMTFDGAAERWFDDVAGLEAVFASETHLQTIRPDEARFLGLHACEFGLSTGSVPVA